MKREKKARRVSKVPLEKKFFVKLLFEKSFARAVEMVAAEQDLKVRWVPKDLKVIQEHKVKKVIRAIKVTPELKAIRVIEVNAVKQVQLALQDK